MVQSLSTTRYDWRDTGCPRKDPIRLLAGTITIGRLGVSNASADRRKTWRAVPAVWSPNAMLQVALSGRLSLYPMSGSAPRFGCIFACAGSDQRLRQFSPLMGTGNSRSTAVFVLFATRFSYYDTYGAGCAVLGNAAPLRRQAAEFHNET